MESGRGHSTFQKMQTMPLTPKIGGMTGGVQGHGEWQGGRF